MYGHHLFYNLLDMKKNSKHDYEKTLIQKWWKLVNKTKDYKKGDRKVQDGKLKCKPKKKHQWG